MINDSLSTQPTISNKITTDLPVNILSAINKDLKTEAEEDSEEYAKAELGKDSNTNSNKEVDKELVNELNITSNKEVDKDPKTNISKYSIINQIKSWGDEWSYIDDKIQNYKEHIKNLNNKKKELTDTIIHKMKVNGISCIDINDGFLQCVEKPTPSGFKKEKVKESVNKCINNMNKADEITEYIFNNKEIVTKNELKKIRKKKVKKTMKKQN